MYRPNLVSYGQSPPNHFGGDALTASEKSLRHFLQKVTLRSNGNHAKIEVTDEMEERNMAVSNTGQGNNWSNHYEVFIMYKGMWTRQMLVHWNPGTTEPHIVSVDDDRYESWKFDDYESALEMAEMLRAHLGTSKYLFLPVHNMHVKELSSAFHSAWATGFEAGEDSATPRGKKSVSALEVF